MADLVFKSTTRGGRDFFEVTDDGMAYGGKDRYNIKTDESMNYADTVDEVLAELVFDGAWRINYDKIEVDELGIGKEFLEIVKLIRKKYNWLYNLPKDSKGRQFYYDIGRYFKQELRKGTDYEKIFDKIDSVIEKNNNFEESKKSNKKSIKEERENGFKVSISNNKEIYSFIKPMEFALTSAQLMTNIGGNWAWIDEPTIDESGYMYFKSTKDSHSKIEYDFTKVFTIDVDWGNHQIYFYTKGDALMLHFYRLVDDEFEFLMYGNEKLDGILTRFGK